MKIAHLMSSITRFDPCSLGVKIWHLQACRMEYFMRTMRELGAGISTVVAAMRKALSSNFLTLSLESNIRRQGIPNMPQIWGEKTAIYRSVVAITGVFSILLTTHVQEMRKYMPPGHRLFVEKIEALSNIRIYVRRFSTNDDITAVYNLAVAKLALFRDIHIQIACRYIIGPSRKPLQNLSDGMNLAVASSKGTSAIGLSGTGGTQLMPFLKQSRDETSEAKLL